MGIEGKRVGHFSAGSILRDSRESVTAIDERIVGAGKRKVSVGLSRIPINRDAGGWGGVAPVSVKVPVRETVLSWLRVSMVKVWMSEPLVRLVKLLPASKP